MAEYTRTAPPARIASLLRFSKRFSESKDVMDKLREWDMNFQPTLQRIENARTLDPEPIFFRNGQSYRYTEEDADWSKGFR